MTKEFEYLDLKIAVVLIVNNGRILTVFNNRWCSYTLPMTKRQQWKMPDGQGGVVDEDWVDAAIRARAEWVPGTSRNAPGFELHIPEYQQSDRDGQWKRYEFHVFKLELADEASLLPGANTEWLTPDEILDTERRPISKTARDIVSRAKADAALNNKPFP